MNFLFPYMARWKAVNWTRYHQIFTLLAEWGHTVHVIQAPAHKSTETNFREIEARVPGHLHLHEVNVNPLVWNLKFPLNKLVKKGYYSFVSFKKIREIIKAYKIDVLFLYNIPQYPLMNSEKCLKIFDLADDYMAMLNTEMGWLSNRLFLGIGQSILNTMIEKSDITLSVSQVLANSVTHKKVIHILPNGVTLNEAVSGRGADIRERYNKPIIGFVGSFEYFVDFDLILNSAEGLPRCTFLLVGSGREYARVESEINKRSLKNVILTGGVPHTEIFKYIDAMDICLNIFKKITISHGACPLKLFEYLSMKKPVISTRLEEIKNIDQGFLFYADTAQELTEVINRVITNPEIANQYSQKGWNTVKEKYQWPAITQELLAIIVEIKTLKSRQ